jgi:hypothetical protein
MDKRPPIVEVNIATLHALLERIGSQVSHEDYEVLKLVVANLLQLTSLVRERGATIARLRRFVGLSSSEKTARVLGKPGQPSKPSADGGGAASGQAAAGATPATGAAEPQEPAKPDAASDVAPGAGAPKASDEIGAGAPAQDEPKPKPKPKGHGRVPAADYLLGTSRFPTIACSLEPAVRTATAARSTSSRRRRPGCASSVNRRWRRSAGTASACDAAPAVRSSRRARPKRRRARSTPKRRPA